MYNNSKPWIIKVLTLFPEMFPGPLGISVTGKALKNNIWTMEAINIRDYATDKHKSVDDTPYGGGGGMILRADVLSRAITHCFTNDNPIIYLSPRGLLFDQDMARVVPKKYEGINILCGRFEGIDERVLQNYNIIEISIGDYIISSGDLAAYVFIDACLRNIPSVLHAQNALSEESFGNTTEYRYLLEYPHYTKPMIWDNMKVPDVLLTGDHQKISKWRLQQAEIQTAERRKDLWEKYLQTNK